MTIAFILHSYVSIEMSEEDEKMLLSRMLDFLPERDVVSYVFRLETFEWNNVRFGHFSAKQCQEQFHRIVTKVRRSNLLACLKLKNESESCSVFLLTLRSLELISMSVIIEIFFHWYLQIDIGLRFSWVHQSQYISL